MPQDDILTDGSALMENFLGRIEHGGWDCQMTSIIEIYDTDQGSYGEGICRDMAGDGVRRQLPDIEDQEGKIAGGGRICPTLTAGQTEIYYFEDECDE